jgi:hypothetical protein
MFADLRPPPRRHEAEKRNRDTRGSVAKQWDGGTVRHSSCMMQVLELSGL